MIGLEVVMRELGVWNERLVLGFNNSRQKVQSEPSRDHNALFENNNVTNFTKFGVPFITLLLFRKITSLTLASLSVVLNTLHGSRSSTVSLDKQTCHRHP